MAYDSRAVANYFLKGAQDRGLSLTPMHILKLVYIAHGWYLALYDRPLISDRIEAWNYGPVIPALYHAVKRFGNQEITATISELEIEKPKRQEFRKKFDEPTRLFLNRILEVYGGLKAFQLSSLTHAEGTPWHSISISEGGVALGPGIPDNLIQEHFKQLAAQNGRPAE